MSNRGRVASRRRGGLYCCCELCDFLCVVICVCGVFVNLDVMDVNLYDEFGNYVGFEIGLLDDDDDVVCRDESWDDCVVVVMNVVCEDVYDVFDVSEDDVMDDDDLNVFVIMFVEDKKYYLIVEEVYGEGTEMFVENEDA